MNSIPNDNIINDCGKNVHFWQFRFGIFHPKFVNSTKLFKPWLKHIVIIVDLIPNIKIIASPTDSKQ